MTVFKLGHSWWHFFFTRWILTDDHGLHGEYHVFYCSKCDKGFHVKTDLYGRLISVRQDEPN